MGIMAPGACPSIPLGMSILRGMALLLLVGGAVAIPRYCVACERRHVARHWHLAAGTRICHRAFVRRGRWHLPGAVHAGHMVLHRHRERLDVTHRRIAALKYRVDTTAFRDAYVLLGVRG